MIFKCSMLTYDTLSRYEKLIDASKLTEAQRKQAEDLAYCANMGDVESNDQAWSNFLRLVMYFGLDSKKEGGTEQ